MFSSWFLPRLGQEKPTLDLSLRSSKLGKSPGLTAQSPTHRVRAELDGCGVLAAAHAPIALDFAAEAAAATVQLCVCPVALCL